MMFLSSFGSLGTSRTLISASSASRRASSAFSSSCASSRMSGSLSSSSFSAISRERRACIRGTSRPAAASPRPPSNGVRNLALSAWTAGSRHLGRHLLVLVLDGRQLVEHLPRSRPARARWTGILASLALDRSSSPGHRRQERDLVAVVQRRRQPRVVLVHGARDAARRSRPSPGTRATSACHASDRRRARRAPRASAPTRRRFRAAARTAGSLRARAAPAPPAAPPSSAGSAVAPSIQTSPPSKCSCFQIGAICLTRSIA